MLIDKMRPSFEIESAIEILKRNNTQSLNLNETTILCNLFEIIPILDMIPKGSRIKVMKIFQLMVYEPGEIILSEENVSPDLHIILSGLCQVIKAGYPYDPNKKKRVWEKYKKSQNNDSTQENKKKQVRAPTLELNDFLFPPSFFGDTSKYVNKKYKPLNVISLDKTLVLLVSNSLTKKIVEEENTNAQFKEDIIFLSKYLDGYSSLSSMYKERIVSIFKQKTFNKSSIILKEGDALKSVYLIKEGECRISSERNTIKYFLDTRNSYETRDFEITKNRGYMSSSLNTFQLGILGHGQWIGDEILILKKAPNIYSTIAETLVTVLEISKGEFLSKFPRDFYQTLTENAEKKFEHIYNRFNTISSISQKVADMNPESFRFDDNLVEFSKKLPLTNPKCLTKIRKKYAFVKPQKSILSIFNKMTATDQLITHISEAKKSVGNLNLNLNLNLNFDCNQNAEIKKQNSVHTIHYNPNGFNFNFYKNSKYKTSLPKISKSYFFDQENLKKYLTISGSSGSLDKKLMPVIATRNKIYPLVKESLTQESNSKIDEDIQKIFSEKKLHSFHAGNKEINLLSKI